MKSLYLVCLLPPPDLSKEIDTIRKECSNKFQVFKALRPPVHITLYPPISMEAAKEKPFSMLMAKVAANARPFTQELENFGKFGKQVVYINAVVNTKLMELRQAIASNIERHRFAPTALNKTEDFHPHFTIAYRDVLPHIFHDIWNEYKDRKFKASFFADKLSLLKHDGKRWNLLENYSLSGSR